MLIESLILSLYSVGSLDDSVDMLDYRDQDIVFVMSLYGPIKKLLVAKYGPPDDSLNDARTVNMGGEGLVGMWTNLRTDGTPPVTSNIRLPHFPVNSGHHTV